jgi:putative restriction endonuclease
LVRLFIANTDLAWFNFLSQRQPLDEVNHWQPGGRLRFNALAPGELLVFRLKAPINRIAGYGVFARSALLPINLAWSAFDLKNGHPDFQSFKDAIHRLNPENRGTIGFRVLTQPIFLPRGEWFEPPSDWPTHVQGGKGYSTETGEGRALWERLCGVQRPLRTGFAEPPAMFGAPTLVRPRLGQGAFRVGVIEAYEHRCVVTGERTLPALEAAHILPITQEGRHEISNGLLLRRDLHALFDQHYLTITPEKRLLVSRRIREEFENGREYYAMHGREVRPPKLANDAPSIEALQRHNDQFVG